MKAWVEESGEEKESGVLGHYLDVTPVMATLACLEELITVLGAENVFLVIYGKSFLREKNWIDYRGLWSLGLRKENVLLCAQQSEVGKTLQQAGISVFFSTSSEAILSAAEVLTQPPTPTPTPTFTPTPTQPPTPSASLEGVFGVGISPVLLGLFRGQGVASSSLRAALPIDKFSSVKYVFNDFEDDEKNGLQEQWGSAMKLMAEKGLPPMRLRAFESKTIHWMTQSSHAAAAGAAPTSNSNPLRDITGKQHKEEEDEDPDNPDSNSDDAVTWWRLLKGVVFREERAPDLSDELRSGDDPAEDLLYYEGDRLNWTWFEVFGQLLHSDNTVAISTVCCCKDEKEDTSRNGLRGPPI